jgi:hypothetical protein
MMVHVCNHSIQEAEAGGLHANSQCGLDSEFETGLDYTVRP